MQRDIEVTLEDDELPIPTAPSEDEVDLDPEISSLSIKGKKGKKDKLRVKLLPASHC